jgi:hypothetical protein
MRQGGIPFPCSAAGAWVGNGCCACAGPSRTPSRGSQL